METREHTHAFLIFGFYFVIYVLSFFRCCCSVSF